jgi:hypothetical protein
MFKERDAEGKEIVDPVTGKAKLGADFQPFVRKVATTALEDFSAATNSRSSRLAACGSAMPCKKQIAPSRLFVEVFRRSR